jgi:hypothetical protein
MTISITDSVAAALTFMNTEVSITLNNVRVNGGGGQRGYNESRRA